MKIIQPIRDENHPTNQGLSTTRASEGARRVASHRHSRHGAGDGDRPVSGELARSALPWPHSSTFKGGVCSLRFNDRLAPAATRRYNSCPKYCRCSSADRTFHSRPGVRVHLHSPHQRHKPCTMTCNFREIMSPEARVSS